MFCAASGKSFSVVSRKPLLRGRPRFDVNDVLMLRKKLARTFALCFISAISAKLFHLDITQHSRSRLLFSQLRTHQSQGICSLRTADVMSSPFFRSNNLTLAWAARVSRAQLGASVTAYAETREGITEFRSVVKKTPLVPLRTLPEEIVSKIESEVRSIAFRHDMKEWSQMSNCLSNTCTPLSHITQEEVDRTRDQLSRASEGAVEQKLVVLAYPLHIEALQAAWDELTWRGSVGTYLESCAQVSCLHPLAAPSFLTNVLEGLFRRFRYYSVLCA